MKCLLSIVLGLAPLCESQYRGVKDDHPFARIHGREPRQDLPANLSTEDHMKVDKIEGIRYALQTRVDMLGNVPPSSPIGLFIRNEPVTINALIADLEKNDGYGDLVVPLRDALGYPSQFSHNH
jgi:hypothetical protein